MPDQLALVGHPPPPPHLACCRWLAEPKRAGARNSINTYFPSPIWMAPYQSPAVLGRPLAEGAQARPAGGKRPGWAGAPGPASCNRCSMGHKSDGRVPCHAFEHAQVALWWPHPSRSQARGGAAEQGSASSLCQVAKPPCTWPMCCSGLTMISSEALPALSLVT